MWYIQLCEDDNTQVSVYDFAGRQLLGRNTEHIYYSIQEKCNEDYKILNNILEEHIIIWINNMPSNTVELYVYNYGIDNAIILLNKFNNSNTTKKYTNKTSRSLLFALLYNKFYISYVPSMHDTKYYTTTSTQKYNLLFSKIILIQRVWRKVLAYRNEVKKGTIYKEFSYLIDKINKEIIGEHPKRILIYLVNKFRKRVNMTLKL